ncbi:MAG: type VI secretion system tube protein Hcp [Kiritimatiellaeota bacterium]|nr:type VI secretion system tube protein Hcp [Kiritimatiellota bacterium]
MALDAFIQIEGIEGESTDDKHKNWIEVDSYCLGAKQASSGKVSTGGSMTASRTELKPFTFTHVIDKATPKLQEACTKGSNLKKVTFEVCRASAGGQTVFFQVTMINVTLIRAELAGTPNADPVGDSILPSGTELPTEEIELLPMKITWKYTETKKDGAKGGSIEANWDQSLNKGA